MSSYLDTDGHPDAAAIVAHYWPADGPYSPESVASAALALDELARYLARATHHAHHTVSRGADLYQLLGELHSSASSLDQVLAQAATAAARLGADPTVYDDRRDGHSPADTSREAQGALDAARFHLGAVIAPLGLAHAATSHLGHND